MSYQAFYRKYRPTTFDEIFGQDHIVKTLTNQIKNDQISHAYLFTGTRGVGKTTAARILAKAVNCLNPIDGNPCLKCRNCAELSGNSGVDVIEMDAASNNGVDYARDIRDKAQYLPVNGKYKVYIIDEVHMLSTPAFNALLKTLEEPPSHIIFILCTTEVQKIPATILSRCMRFDFHLVAANVVAKIISNIFDENGVKYTTDAINAIAVAGEGSVRDSLSIADRCVAFCDGEMTYEDVLNVLGATNRDILIEFGNQIVGGNVGELLKSIDILVKEGKSISVLAKDLSSHFRDMLVVKTCRDAKEMLSLPDSIYIQLESAARDVTNKKLLYAIDVYSTLEGQLRYSLSPRMLFEAATLRVATSSGEVDLDGIDMRLKQLEKRGAVGATTGYTATPAPSADYGKITTQTPGTAPQTSARNYEAAKPIWAKTLAEVRKLDMPLISTLLTEISSVWLENKVLVLLCNDNQYRILSEKENFAVLRDLVAQSNCSLKLNKNPNADSESTLKKLAGMVGGNIVIE